MYCKFILDEGRVLSIVEYGLVGGYKQVIKAYSLKHNKSFNEYILKFVRGGLLVT